MSNPITKIDLNGTEYTVKDEDAQSNISELKEDLTAIGLSVVNGTLCQTYNV